MMEKTPCRCGADDCSRCHPENYHFGLYITDDPDEFEVTYLGMHEGILVTGPNGFRQTFDAEEAEDFAEDGEYDLEAFVKKRVLDNAAYACWLAENR